MTVGTAVTGLAVGVILTGASFAAGITYKTVQDHYAITAPEPCRENKVVHADGSATPFPGLEAHGVMICGAALYEVAGDVNLARMDE